MFEKILDEDFIVVSVNNILYYEHNFDDNIKPMVH
jgi:hypothetical protein